MPKVSNAVELWVEALRSGKYEQTQAYLADRSGFCCLGVACELAVEAGIISPSFESGIHTNGVRRYENNVSCLPPAVLNWLGLNSETGLFNEGTEDEESLAGLNDNGKTFAEIADVIEARPEGLFDGE